MFFHQLPIFIGKINIAIITFPMTEGEDFQVDNHHSYGNLLDLTGYKWDYTFYKWGYKYF